MTGFIEEHDKKDIASSAAVSAHALEALKSLGDSDRPMHWTYFWEKYQVAKRCMNHLDEIAASYGIKEG